MAQRPTAPKRAKIGKAKAATRADPAFGEQPESGQELVDSFQIIHGKNSRITHIVHLETKKSGHPERTGARELRTRRAVEWRTCKPCGDDRRGRPVPGGDDCSRVSRRCGRADLPLDPARVL